MNAIPQMFYKKRLKTVFLTIFLAVGLLMSTTIFKDSIAHATDSQLYPDSFSELAEKVSPAVINIRTVRTIKGGGRVYRHFSKPPFGNNDPGQEMFERFFGLKPHRDYKQRSLGSGFIIDKDGYIVTNNHVIENADKIMVKLKDGKEYDAEIIGRDPNTDLALIKIDSDNDLPKIAFGSSSELKVGQWVVAIGSPFGLEHTVTAGIVSAKGRVIGSGPYDDFIQTDASINPGNSGGPLINLDGNVIGINTAIVAGGQGIGFAIPVDMAKGIIAQLKSHGSVTRGWLGVGIQDLNDEIAGYYGVKGKKGALVIEVFKDDPADLAGIKPKDIIIEINDKNVESSRDLTGLIANIPVSETIKVKVLRNGREKTFNVTIAKREDIVSASDTIRKDNELGIHVSELTSDLSRRLKIKDSRGVIVSEVEPGSKGAEGGIKPGDIIKEINHKEIKTVDDYQKTIKKFKKGDAINLFISRINRGFLVIKLVK